MLKEQKEILDLKNIYGNQFREKLLASLVKDSCVSIKNVFREMVSTLILSTMFPSLCARVLAA